jgi:hypothetical protein
MRAFIGALAVVIVGTSAASADEFQGFIHNKSSTGLSFSIVDNGAKVCDLAPDKFCNWSMASGYHRVELVRSDGVAIWGDYEVKDKSSVPNTPIEDCDFQSSCPASDVTALAPQ